MKKIILPVVYVAAFLFSCNEEPKKATSDSLPDSAKAPVVVQPRLDSLMIDPAKSSFACTRSKTVKDFEKEITLFGAKTKVKLDNANFTAESNVSVLGGAWYTVDGKLRDGRLVLDMASVEAVKVGSDQKLAMGNPDYLDSKNYPYAYVDIKKIILPAATDSLHKEVEMIATLTLKGKTDTIDVHKIKFEETTAGSGIPKELQFDFAIDGIKWGLNKKEVKVTKDDLKFHVIMKNE